LYFYMVVFSSLTRSSKTKCEILKKLSISMTEKKI